MPNRSLLLNLLRLRDFGEDFGEDFGKRILRFAVLSLHLIRSERRASGPRRAAHVQGTPSSTHGQMRQKGMRNERTC